LDDLDEERRYAEERHAVRDANEHVGEEELVFVADPEGGFEVEFGVDDGGRPPCHTEASAFLFLGRQEFGEGSGVWEEEAMW